MYRWYGLTAVCYAYLADVPPGDDHRAEESAFRERDIRHVQLPISHHYEIAYSFTPYGIRAQFQMIPLTLELLSAMIPYSGIKLEHKLDDSQWYLALLGCEHIEHPGHLLGRVCHIPSSESEVDFMYCGYIDFCDMDEAPQPDLFRLSPGIIKQFRLQTEMKTVYIPHPQSNYIDSDPLKNLRRQPYTTIKLVLLTETCDALRSQGYKADLHDPEPDHPTTHWLTLSKDEHTTTVEFQHALKNDGKEFTIDATVGMRSCVRLDDASDSDQADRRVVSWYEGPWGSGWTTTLDRQTAQLGAAEAGMLTLDLSLDFAGAGVYLVQVDIQSDAAPASPNVESTLPAPGSAVGSTGDQGQEVGPSGDDSSSSAIDSEDSEAGWEEDSGGREVVPGEAQDLEAASDDARDGDRGST